MEHACPMAWCGVNYGKRHSRGPQPHMSVLFHATVPAHLRTSLVPLEQAVMQEYVSQ
jgi:hypothetical protein